jgi:hypothetical protein
MKRFLKYTSSLLLILLICATLILYDLHQIEKESKWSGLERFRVNTYLRTCLITSYLLPAIGSLKIVPDIRTLTKALADKELPAIETMDFYRDLLMNPSFREQLQMFEQENIRLYSQNGQTRFVQEIKQRVYFGEYRHSMYDDWMVLLCTHFIKGKPRTSYLVWGLGVAIDMKSYKFFSKQSSIIGKCVPVIWLTQLEREGLAKGYWCLLTESNTTSSFSYDARYLQPRVRKQMWLSQIKP